MRLLSGIEKVHINGCEIDIDTAILLERRDEWRLTLRSWKQDLRFLQELSEVDVSVRCAAGWLSGRAIAWNTHKYPKRGDSTALLTGTSPLSRKG